jgi:hypothetical protein
MKQCRIVVDEKENTDRKIEAKRYAIQTTITMGNAGEYTLSFRLSEY